MCPWEKMLTAMEAISLLFQVQIFVLLFALCSVAELLLTLRSKWRRGEREYKQWRKYILP